METQNIQSDNDGRYDAQLGATRPRDYLWLCSPLGRRAGSVSASTEHPNSLVLLLLSAPYALKAGDAQTLGGFPPSAFLLADPAAHDSMPLSTGTARTITPNLGGGGTKGYLSLWTDNAGDLGNSAIFQSGIANSAKVGINTTTPAAALDVKGGGIFRGSLILPATAAATLGAGKASQPEAFTASAFNSGTGVPVSQTFQWEAEPTGNYTASPSATFNLLFGSAGAAPTETGLHIARNGQVTFPGGQTFPGTIAGVTTSNGSGLTGGGVIGNLNLSLTNTCANGQVLQSNGGSWNCVNAAMGTITGVTAGTDLLGGGSSGNVTLSLDTSKVPQLTASNTFTTNQNIVGSLGVGSTTTNATLQLSAKDTSYTGVQNVTTNISTAAGPSFAVLAATSNAGVTAEMVADGHGNGAMATPGGYVGTYTNSPFGFITGNQQRMQIASTGEIGIGLPPPGIQLTMFTVYANPARDFEGAIIEGADGGAGAVLQGGAGDGILDGGAGGLLAGGDTTNAVGGDGIDAYAGGGSPAGYAGAFFGDVVITGNLSKAGGSFRIDHPLDPANKYLYHSFVESPDMMNVYNGIATLDGSGEASIELPTWFETLNRDFRYQLTPVGAPGPNLYVAGEVAQNSFRVAGGKPGMKVSWQITGVRQDPWANAHRIPVEEDKPARERGYYLHPELYQAPPEKGVDWARHPQMMQRMTVDRQKSKAAPGETNH